jgi:hypothetical protein
MWYYYTPNKQDTPTRTTMWSPSILFHLLVSTEMLLIINCDESTIVAKTIPPHQLNWRWHKFLMTEHAKNLVLWINIM